LDIGQFGRTWQQTNLLDDVDEPGVHHPLLVCPGRLEVSAYNRVCFAYPLEPHLEIRSPHATIVTDELGRAVVEFQLAARLQTIEAFPEDSRIIIK
jgi:hypothetical protein